VATGVGGADDLLRDGRGGVGGRYVYMIDKRPRNDTNASLYTHLWDSSNRHGRLVYPRGGCQLFQTVVRILQRYVFLFRRTAMTAGFPLPKIHLLERHLLLWNLGHPLIRSISNIIWSQGTVSWDNAHLYGGDDDIHGQNHGWGR
jgi:hypothetical protein